MTFAIFLSTPDKFWRPNLFFLFFLSESSLLQSTWTWTMNRDNDKQTRRWILERRNICMIIKDKKKARNDNDIQQIQITDNLIRFHYRPRRVLNKLSRQNFSSKYSERSFQIFFYLTKSFVRLKTLSFTVNWRWKRSSGKI